MTSTKISMPDLLAHNKSNAPPKNHAPAKCFARQGYARTFAHVERLMPCVEIASNENYARLKLSKGREGDLPRHVELPAAMVAQHNPGAAGPQREHGVFGALDALEDKPAMQACSC